MTEVVAVAGDQYIGHVYRFTIFVSGWSIYLKQTPLGTEQEILQALSKSISKLLFSVRDC